MGEEQFPAVVAPEGLQAEQGFIAGGAPELAASFHAALELAAGRLDGAGAQRFPALPAGPIPHALLVVTVILDGPLGGGGGG